MASRTIDDSSWRRDRDDPRAPETCAARPASPLGNPPFRTSMTTTSGGVGCFRVSRPERSNAVTLKPVSSNSSRRCLSSELTSTTLCDNTTSTELPNQPNDLPETGSSRCRPTNREVRRERQEAADYRSRPHVPGPAGAATIGKDGVFPPPPPSARPGRYLRRRNPRCSRP